VRTSTSLLYVDFMLALTGTVVAASGRDCLWARALPALVAERGRAEVGGEGDFAFLRGGSPMTEFFQLTGEQRGEKVVSSGAWSAERCDAGLALQDAPKFWAFAGARESRSGEATERLVAEHACTGESNSPIASSDAIGLDDQPWRSAVQLARLQTALRQRRSESGFKRK
jgi:hypothetical protein